jgi:hypothetical protein
LICGLVRGVDDSEEAVESAVIEGLGVLNAPVEAFCNRSNSSCSLGGSRGGAGPVANAVRRLVEAKKRQEGRRNLGGSSRDIVFCFGLDCNTDRFEGIWIWNLDLLIAKKQIEIEVELLGHKPGHIVPR